LKMVPFESLGTFSYWPFIATMARYRSKMAIFFIPLAFDATVRKVPVAYCHNVWCRKTRVVCLPVGRKSFTIRLAVSTEYRRVTDRRTDRQKKIDGQTSCHGIVRAMHTHRAVIIEW